LFEGTSEPIPERLIKSHSEQFWLHENAINSFLQAKEKTALPYIITD
jgi:hypothetical protein